MKKYFPGIIIVLLLSAVQDVLAQTNEWEGLEKVFGKKGTLQEGVYKITFPRWDLKVTVGEFPVDPRLALTSWIGFIKTRDTLMGMQMDNRVMMMGDLVLMDEEVAPVVAKIVSSGLSVTAIHNHIIRETPDIKYVHFSGNGDATKLAQSIKDVIAQTGTPLQDPRNNDQQTSPDWTAVESVLGTGKHAGNMLQFAFPRKERLTESGMQMPPSIGMATAVNFQMSDKKAGITGDFVLLASEVNPVVKALTENGVVVTAIHNHMLFDEPRLFMLHFWAVDDPGKLALAIKEALDKTNSGK